MYYALFCIALAATFLFAINFAGSLLASILWRVSDKFIKNQSAQNRAKVVFALGVLPSLAALVFVFVFLVPAFLLFEPDSPKEFITFKLAALALIGISGGVLAIYRFCRGWLATRRLIKNWLAQSDLIELANVSVPVYRIKHPFPVIAVVGMLRPKMFIAGQVFDLLDEKELQAAVAHEIGHLNARDNLKSAALRFCRDLLVFAPFDSEFIKAWKQNTESAADEYAARSGKQNALNLAGALLKIARVVPKGAKPSLPAGAFLIEQQTADVSWRVRRLLQPTEKNLIRAENRRFDVKVSLLLYLVAFIGAMLWLATNHEFQYKIHLAYESVVAALQ